jgi:molybdate-binding protein/DNA-binding transcriptional regulator YhcF (GntR family)
MVQADIQIDHTAAVPIYMQIAVQIKQLIATGKMLTGSRLPTVRELARTLEINPGTVVRAYLALEQDRIIVSRRGSGTVVKARSNDPAVSRLRQRRLSTMVSDQILEVLSLGYSPEELEAAFSTHLSRWREERRKEETVTHPRAKVGRGVDSLVIVASHDLVLSLLVSKLREVNPQAAIQLTYAGSLGGLIALQEERIDLAGIHLLDEETGEYNNPYLRHLLPGRKMAVVNLSYRVQGLMVAKNNPKHINGFNDLKRDDVTFVNRQKGSGTRVLLDFELRKAGIDPSEVNGYDRETDTHFAVANSVLRGEADVGLGIKAAADASELDFLSIVKERYDLVIPVEKYRVGLIAILLDIATSADFKSVVANVGGYDTSQTGSVTFLR